MGGRKKGKKSGKIQLAVWAGLLSNSPPLTITAKDEKSVKLAATNITACHSLRKREQ